MKIIETARLTIRHMVLADAAFILELVNDPAFLKFIGDRGVRTLDDAHAYITNGPLASYAQNGFGLFVAELKDSATPIGMCGLIKRPTLEDVDIGYAYLPQYRGQGYAFEAAAAVFAHGRNTIALPRIVAITDPKNAGSIRVLEKIGLRFDRLIKLAEDDDEICFYTSDPIP